MCRPRGEAPPDWQPIPDKIAHCAEHHTAVLGSSTYGRCPLARVMGAQNLLCLGSGRCPRASRHTSSLRSAAKLPAKRLVRMTSQTLGVQLSNACKAAHKSGSCAAAGWRQKARRTSRSSARRQRSLGRRWTSCRYKRPPKLSHQSTRVHVCRRLQTNHLGIALRPSYRPSLWLVLTAQSAFAFGRRARLLVGMASLLTLTARLLSSTR